MNLRDFMPPSLAAFALYFAAATAMHFSSGCAAQKPACQVIHLADQACVWLQTADGQRVQVPAAMLHRVAMDAQAAAARGSATPSASSSAPAPAASTIRILR
jgi:hypothetical protein